MSGLRTLNILGTRGIPAEHGGFETFAERLALYLVAKDWDIIVYCQEDGNGRVYEDSWNGVRRVHVPVVRHGAVGTIVFDWKSTLLAASAGGLMLVLGYNTAVFSLLHRLKRRRVLMNMDGIEWKRQKWSVVQKGWLYLNERAGSMVANHMIADHPEIKAHLARHAAGERITVIPYGADVVKDAPVGCLEKLGLKPGGYCLVVARPEPENSIIEMVSAFSRKKRACKLVVLGRFDPSKNDYHRRVTESVGAETVFPGAIYEKETIEALRFHCLLYLHGHSVGGTNPSLVEALGAGSAVLAHDNRFNRWVAGQGARYFDGVGSCARRLDEALGDPALIEAMREASVKRHLEEFTWSKVLSAYEALLVDALGDKLP